MSTSITSVNLDDRVKKQLQLRADRNFRSVSGEVNYVLKTFFALEARMEIETFRALVSDPPAG